MRYGLVPENEEDEVEYASSHLPEVKVLLDQSSNPRRCNFALRAHATLRSSDYHGSERAMMKNHVYFQMILSRSLSSDITLTSSYVAWCAQPLHRTTVRSIMTLDSGLVGWGDLGHDVP